MTVHIPVQIAELLHATLGPLHDALLEEDHRWAPLVGTMLNTYIRERDTYVISHYGVGSMDGVSDATCESVEIVAGVAEKALEEAADFVTWASEFDGADETP